MKRKILYWLVLLIVSGCEIPEKKPVVDVLSKAEVYSAIRAFDSAWLSKNTPDADAVLSASYIYFTPSGNIFPRDSILATAGTSLYRLLQAERVILDVHIDGNTAVVNTRWKGRGEYRGAPFNDDQRCSVTLVKKDNSVKILSEHCTSIKKSLSDSK